MIDEIADFQEKQDYKSFSPVHRRIPMQFYTRSVHFIIIPLLIGGFITHFMKM